MTSETHKYTAAAGSFFSMTEHGKQMQIDDYAVCTTILYVNEATNSNDTMKNCSQCWSNKKQVGTVHCYLRKGSRNKSQNEISCTERASAQEVRGYYKQFGEAKHLEYRSWIDNEVFDLINVRRVKSRNFVTGRRVLTIKADKVTSSRQKADGY